MFGSDRRSKGCVGLRDTAKKLKQGRPCLNARHRLAHNVVWHFVLQPVVHAATRSRHPDTPIFPPLDIPNTHSQPPPPVDRTSPHDGPCARRISNAGPIRAPECPRGGHIEQGHVPAQCRLLDEAGRHAIIPARRPPSPEFFLHQILITAHSPTTTNPRCRFSARSMAQTHPWST